MPKALARASGAPSNSLLQTVCSRHNHVLQVKADAAKMGDLGAVAEASRGCQRTMFRPAPLTVQGVFAKLKDIAQMQGHAAMNQKAGKIQGMLVACRDNEAK